ALRAALAATLGPAWGMYSGFELVEDGGVAGTEDYEDSEKYEVKHRDWDAPGNIKPLVTRLNALRHAHGALQYMRGLWFLPVTRDAMVAYVKAARAGEEHVLGVANLDTVAAHEGWVGLPLAALGLPPEATFEARDVLNDETFEWRGEWNRVYLDPQLMPA